MTLSEFKNILFSEANNIFKNDQRPNPRCVIEVMKTSQSKGYSNFKNELQKEVARITILNEKDLISINYEERRWDNGAGEFTIRFANISTRLNPPVTPGDKVACYMWHSIIPSGTITGIVKDKISKPDYCPNNLVFVGIIDVVTTKVGDSGTIIEAIGHLLVTELDRLGSISLSVRGRPIYLRSDNTTTNNINDENLLLDNEGNPLIVRYEPITVRDILSKFLKILSKSFRRVHENFILPRETEGRMNFGEYWESDTSFGIQPRLLRYKLTHGTFDATGTPLQIFISITELLKNISSVKGIEFFIEPKRLPREDWKGKITIRRSPKKDEILKSRHYMNPRKAPKSLTFFQTTNEEQCVEALLGKNILDTDLLDMTAPIINSILVKGRQVYPTNENHRAELLRAMSLIEEVNVHLYSEETTKYNPINITEMERGIIDFDERFVHEVKVGTTTVFNERDEPLIFGFRSETLIPYRNQYVVVKLINKSSVERFGEISVTIIDENISTFSSALELAKEQLAILSKPAHRLYAIYLDSRTDRIHLWNSILRLKDTRRKSLKETLFQTLAGLDKFLDPRSKMGIFTIYDYYYHNKIMKRFSSDGITTKIACVNERRPGEEVLDDFKSLVKKYVQDIEVEKTIRILIGSVVRELYVDETAESIMNRENRGKFAVLLDDMRFIDRVDITRRMVSTTAVEAEIADSMYMVNEMGCGMYKKPNYGDKVLLLKVGFHYYIIGRIQSFTTNAQGEIVDVLPPATSKKRNDEFIMITPTGGGKLHYGDSLFMNPHAEVDQPPVMNQFANITIGGTRLIALIGRKYEKFNKWVNIFVHKDNNQLYFPRLGLLGESSKNINNFNRSNYSPPHPLGQDGAPSRFNSLKQLENCFWIQCQSGARLFVGEKYFGDRIDGVSEMDRRHSYIQTIAKNVQIFAGGKWKDYSLNSGKEAFRRRPGILGVDPNLQDEVNKLFIDENSEELQIVYFSKNLEKPKMIRINKETITIKDYNNNNVIEMNDDHIQLQKRNRKLTITDSEVNIE